MYTYDGAHAITFINSSNTSKNTWSDWHLIPTQKPVFPAPEFEANYVDIPGRNGSLDLSDYLTGGPSYKDRIGSFEFIFVGSDMNTMLNTICQFLQGKKMKIVLSDDPNFYYEGRVSVTNKADQGYPRLTFACRVGPYKTNRSSGAHQF